MKNGKNQASPRRQRRVELGHYVVADPEICHGKPTFKGTRIMVWQVLEDVADGRSWEFICNKRWGGRIPTAAVGEAVRLAQEALLNSVQTTRPPIARKTTYAGRRLNLLDENFPEDQLPLLQQWRIHTRRVGVDVARLGAKDTDIIPLLHRIGEVTFFTQDADFFDPALCHTSYCLVWLDVRADDAAWFLRRVLKHHRFRTAAKRMGLVVRVHHNGIHYWERTKDSQQSARWPAE